jgi:hypothetical protein
MSSNGVAGISGCPMKNRRPIPVTPEGLARRGLKDDREASDGHTIRTTSHQEDALSLGSPNQGAVAQR